VKATQQMGAPASAVGIVGTAAETFKHVAVTLAL
jgi:hypothetical protein